MEVDGEMQAIPITESPLVREMLESNFTYILDCETEIFIWVGKKSDWESKASGIMLADVRFTPAFFRLDLLSFLFFSFRTSSLCLKDHHGLQSPACSKALRQYCSRASFPIGLNFIQPGTSGEIIENFILLVGGIY